MVMLVAIGAGTLAARAEYGFDVQTTPGDTNAGVTAGDFYTLVDGALGNNFGSLVMVFGGCYSGGFADGLAGSKVGKSGKPVAVLTTNRSEPGQCTPAGINGAPFFSGVFGGFVNTDASNAITNPVSQAFSSGEAQVKNFTDKEVIKKKLNDDTKAVIPASQPDHAWVNGGDKITIDGKDKEHKHAILFMGKPQTVFDWNDLINAYQTLLDAGFKDIKIFFGTGKTADDNMPVLTNDDFTPGISIERDATTYDTPRPIKVLKEIAGGTLPVPQAADFEHLKNALLYWRAIATTAGHADDQFLIAVGTHSTGAAKARDKKELTFPPAKPTSAGGAGGTPKTAGGPPKKKGKMASGGGASASSHPSVMIGIGIGGGRDRFDNTDEKAVHHAQPSTKARPDGHPSCKLGPEFC
jgi:hypothetical protein